MKIRVLFYLGVLIVYRVAASTTKYHLAPVSTGIIFSRSDNVDILKARESHVLKSTVDLNAANSPDGSFREERRQPDGAFLGTYGSYDDDGKRVLRHYVKDRFGYRVLSEYRPYESLGTVTSTDKPDDKINDDDDDVDNKFEEEKDSLKPLPPAYDELTGNISDKKHETINDEIRGNLKFEKNKLGTMKNKPRPTSSFVGPFSSLLKNKFDPLYTAESNNTATSNTTKQLPHFPSSFSLHPQLNKYLNSSHFIIPTRTYLQENFDNDPYDSEFYDSYEDQKFPTFEFGDFRLRFQDRGPDRYNVFNDPHDHFYDHSFRPTYRPHRPFHFNTDLLDDEASEAAKNKVKGVQLINGHIILIQDRGSTMQEDEAESVTKIKPETSDPPYKKAHFFSSYSRNIPNISTQGEKKGYVSERNFIPPDFHSSGYGDSFHRPIRPFNFDDLKYYRSSFDFASENHPF